MVQPIEAARYSRTLLGVTCMCNSPVFSRFLDDVERLKLMTHISTGRTAHRIPGFGRGGGEKHVRREFWRNPINRTSDWTFKQELRRKPGRERTQRTRFMSGFSKKSSHIPFFLRLSYSYLDSTKLRSNTYHAPHNGRGTQAWKGAL